MPNPVLTLGEVEEKVHALLIPCILCDEKFIYESTFLIHVYSVHAQSTTMKRRPSCTTEV